MISPAFLRNFWLITITVFTVTAFIAYQRHSDTLLRRGQRDTPWPWLYGLALIALIGLRDPHSFADTILYTMNYNALSMGGDPQWHLRDNQEWIWNLSMYTFATSGAPIAWFYTTVALGYIGFMLLGIYRLIPNNQWLAFIFCASSFSFISYGTNGIRNGLACSIIIYALSFFKERNMRGLVIGVLLSYVAVHIHGSTILPALCAVAALYVVRSTKAAMGWWVFAILLSLAIGSSLQEIFASLGFDKRLQSYAGTEAADSAAAKDFTYTGFRWDFLLYSAMPILLGYYIVVVRRVRHRTYEFLLNTYILANAFWVMVIRANFSNRFAYLSWFLYPLVLAYPLLRVRFARDQDLWTAYILLASTAFTLFMVLFYF